VCAYSQFAASGTSQQGACCSFESAVNTIVYRTPIEYKPSLVVFVVLSFVFVCDYVSFLLSSGVRSYLLRNRAPLTAWPRQWSTLPPPHAHEPAHPLLRSLELAPLAPPNSSNASHNLACLLARAGARLPPRRSAARDYHRDAPSPPQLTTATLTACVGHVGTPASRRDV